jgi:hypothetical protein
MNGHFINLGETLKLVPPFKGIKHEFLAFIGNVVAAFAVTNPSQGSMLYKFVPTLLVESQERQSVTETSKIRLNVKSFCKTLT